MRMGLRSRRRRNRKKELFKRSLLIALIFVAVLFLIVFIVKSRGEDEPESEEVLQENVQSELQDNDPEVLQKEELGNEVPELTLEQVKEMSAGSTLDEELLSEELIEQLFYQSEITEEVKQRIWNVSYKENAQISLDNLRYLRVLHRGFDEKTHIGEMIVNKIIAEDVVEIMRELYANDYLIEKMLLIDEYNADDEASMQDNNSSAFNYRMIANTNTLSRHGMGMAVDINPRYNPYVVTNANGSVYISPENGLAYADRSKDFVGKIEAGDLCVKLFAEHGFSWGGYWSDPKDYQHFER